MTPHPRWIMYWVAVIDAHLGPGRSTIRTQAIVAGQRPHPDRQPSSRVPSRAGWRLSIVRPPQIVTRWFLTYAEYEAWKDTLPVAKQIDADLYAHVGHTPLGHVPNECTACALNVGMYQVMTRRGVMLLCKHGFRPNCEECS